MFRLGTVTGGNPTVVGSPVVPGVVTTSDDATVITVGEPDDEDDADKYGLVGT